MYHSITFGDGTLYPAGHEKEGQFKGVNTWDDWHLIPSSRPVIASPGVSTSFVDIPGRQGAIDMTEYLTGHPNYGSRSGSFEFYVDNDHEYWETIRMKIINFLHGRRYKIVLEDDPRFYWEGRFTLSEWKSESWRSKITIDYAVDPYKIAVSDNGGHDIIWDTFSFETDNDWYAILHHIQASDTPYAFALPSHGYPIILNADLVSEGDDDSVSVSIDGSIALTLTQTNAAQTIVVEDRSEVIAHEITVSGNGTVDFRFREKSL